MDEFDYTADASDVDSYYGDGTEPNYGDGTEPNYGEHRSVSEEELVSQFDAEFNSLSPENQAVVLDSIMEGWAAEVGAPRDLLETFLENAGGDPDAAEAAYRQYEAAIASRPAPQDHSTADDQIAALLAESGITRREFEPFLARSGGDVSAAIDLYNYAHRLQSDVEANPYTRRRGSNAIEQAAMDAIDDGVLDKPDTRPDARYVHRPRTLDPQERVHQDNWDDAFGAYHEHLSARNGARRLAEKAVRREERGLPGWAN